MPPRAGRKAQRCSARVQEHHVHAKKQAKKALRKAREPLPAAVRQYLTSLSKPKAQDHSSTQQQSKTARCKELVKLLQSDSQAAQQLQQQYPSWDGRTAEWHCSRCHRFVPQAHLSIHRCPEPAQLQLTSGSRCAFCSRVTSDGIHSCQSVVLRHMLVDFSGIEQHSPDHLSSNSKERKLALLREGEAHVVCVLPVLKSTPQQDPAGQQVLEPTGQHQLRQLVIAESQIPGAGKGLYVGEDVQEGDVLCMYTGLRVPSASDSSQWAHLAALTTELKGKKVIRDPSVLGGVAVLANNAHGNTANACMRTVQLPSGLPGSVLVARRSLKAGEEIMWDYQAITTVHSDAADPSFACLCNDPECSGFILKCECRTCLQRSQQQA